MYIISSDNEKLFTGSRQACKQYIRKNNVKRYRLTETFVEKVVTVAEDVEIPKESFFNRIFS